MDGRIEDPVQITGVLSGVGTLNGSLSITPAVIESSITIPERVEIETYDGSYEVIPKLYSQILDTYGKKMREDLTVDEIPVIRTSNPDGGQTVLIG